MALISVCVANYKRPEGLRRLLDGLGRLTFAQGDAPGVEVIVVDNEARGRAAAVCREAEPAFPWTLRCLEEPRRGITYARNRGLLAASPDADFLAFIDDDEVPATSWLEALLRARELHAADVVTGPVVPRLDPGVPAWVVRGRFFGPRSHPDGQRLGVAFTNNTLMRAAIPRELGRAFDHRFALTGGEDTDFFMSVARAGYRIVWAADALVYETVPASRASVGWILRRGYREWGSHSRCEAALYPSPAVRVERVLKASALIAAGVVTLPVSAVVGRHALVRSLLRVARGAGSFAGLMGRHYAEYADRASSPDAGGSAGPPGHRE